MIAAIAIILGIAAMILIHELGHFVAARAFGIEVEEFSIGFGPALFKKKKGNTLYKLSAIPLGGYIKMKGEDPDSELTGSPDEFLSRKPHEKILVALAGPFFNVVLAMLLLPLAFSVFGFQTLIPSENVILAKIGEGTPAMEIGLMRGDRILEVNGETAVNDQWTAQKIYSLAGDTITLKIRRDTEVFTVITASRKKMSQLDTEYYELGVQFAGEPIIGKLKKSSNAYKSGLRENDRIIEVAGDPVLALSDIFEYAEEGEPVEMTVSRNGELLNIPVDPVKESKITQAGKIRPYFTFDISPKIKIERLGLFEGLGASIQEIGMDFTLIYVSLRSIVKDPGQAKNLGGPVAIAYIISKSLKAGFSQYLRWISLISVNLCVVNLLPLIVTDGGLIIIFIFEAIGRRKMNKKEREVFSYIGWGLILFLFAFILFNDITRFF